MDGSPRRLILSLFCLLYLVAALAGYARVSRGTLAASGDFHHFYHAAAAMTEGANIYASGERGYIYPPLVAFLFQPLAALPLGKAASLWLLVNAALLAGAAWAAARTAAARLGTERLKQSAALAALLGSLLLFDKIRADIRLGQTDGLVILPIALALLFLDKRPRLAGLLLGLSGAVKYISLVFVPYLLLRKRWAAAASTVFSWIAWMLLPALSVGWNVNRSYIASALGGFGAMLDPSVGGARAGAGSAPGAVAGIAGVVWERSISLTSALTRACADHGPLATYGAVLAAALACLALGWGLAWKARVPLWKGRGVPADSQPRLQSVVACEWWGLLAATLLFSPQTTARHFVLLLPLAVLAGALWLAAPGRASRLRLALGAAILLAGLYLPPAGIPQCLPMLQAWRALGGGSLCLLVFYFVVFHEGLRFSTTQAPPAPRRVLEIEPGTCPP
ncbi:MAG: glycosyltransferase family 87 protein [Chthoniobacteraceae bacterium]|nr:glycosyltransferase family 87 protein [Chthoniobacteraceae bacterium]